MADEWYFGWGDRRFGPFSESQLMELAGKGRVHRSDTVWKLGIEKGIPAAKVGNLFPPLPVETASAVIENPTTSAPPETVEILRSLPSTASSFDKWLALSGDEKTAAGKHHISDDLTVRPIVGLDDSPSPITPATNGSTTGDAPSNRNPNASKVTDRPNGDPKTSKPKRAVALKGAIIANQDGENVQYRKKCLRCGFEDPSKTSRPIRTGIHRDRFFCPKCRKASEVEIQGIG